MSWHVHNCTSRVFDSDGYGVDTDNPPTAQVLLDYALNAQSERAIQDQPACLQPGLFNERSHCSEEPVHSRVGPARQRKSERSKEDPAQPKIKF